MRALTIVLAILSLPAIADETKPEIVRPTGTPQAIGALHTVRTIPEACVRLEGQFTGNAAQPYRIAAVKSPPSCQPRARFVDFAEVGPTPAKSWKLNDEIRVPNAACPSQLAVVRIWRKSGDAVPPKLDAQGRSRIYLQDAIEQVKSKGTPGVARYAAEMRLQGNFCH